MAEETRSIDELLTHWKKPIGEMSFNGIDIVIADCKQHVIDGGPSPNKDECEEVVIVLAIEVEALRAQRDALVKALQRIHDECLKNGINGIGNIALSAIGAAKDGTDDN